MGFTNFIVNDGSISGTTPNNNYISLTDTHGIVLNSDDGLSDPVQIYLSGNLISEFDSKGKLLFLTRGIYDAAPINFNSDGTDPSTPAEGDIWRNGDKLYLRTSIATVELTNQITNHGLDTEILLTMVWYLVLAVI